MLSDNVPFKTFCIMALVWFVDKFPRSRKPVQYRRLDDIVSFNSQVDRLERQYESSKQEPGNTFQVIHFLIWVKIVRI